MPLVVLGAGADSPMADLLAVLDRVLKALPRRAVLIGGVAVAARLGTVERATGDVDTVIDAPDEPASAEMLLASKVAQQKIDENSVLVDGVKVDLIDTFAVPQEALADGGGDNHFVAAHRFGFDSASSMRLSVEDGPEVTAHVAEAAGLVAMKLHAAQWRRDRERKLPGDLFDLYRLLRVFDREGELRQHLPLRARPARRRPRTSPLLAGLRRRARRRLLRHLQLQLGLYLESLRLLCSTGTGKPFEA